MHLSSAFPGRGTPGLREGGESAKIEEECAPVPDLSGLPGLFLARGLGTYSGVSGTLPLSLLT